MLSITIGDKGIKMESRTSSFFKGVSVQTVVTVVMGVLEIITFSLFSRLLSKSDFGYYAAISGVIAIIQSISEAGLGASIIQKKNASESFVSTAFTLSIGLGVFFSACLFISSPYVAKLVADDTITLPLRIMSLSFIFHSLISVGNAQLYRKLCFKRVGTIKFLSYLMAGILGCFLAYRGLGLYSIVVFTISDSLFTVLLLYGTSVRLPKLRFSREDSKNIIHFGGWLTLGVILNNMTRQLDKIVTSKLISVEALGSYNRPAGFVTRTTSKITGIFDNVLFPILSGIQGENSKILDVFYKSISMVNSISAVLSVVFFFNAELIIIVFFGEKWLDLVPVMRIVSIGVLFNVDGQLVDCFFRSLNFVKTGFFIRLAGAIITLLAIIIGARFDIIGLAIGVVSANIIVILIKVTTLSIKVKANFSSVISSWLSAWKPVVALVIVGIISIFFPSTITKYIILAIVFAVMIFLEFIVFPNSVSKTYVQTVYPYVLSVTHKLERKIKRKG